MSAPVDVVVPVYRDVGATVACLEAVLAHSGPRLGRLIVVDDCSPEPEMAAALRRLAADAPAVTLLRNDENLGFVRTANRGLALRQGDVVLLNSDTRVTPGWLEALCEAAAAPSVAAAVPLSNNATFCSVPLFGRGVDASRLDGVERLLPTLAMPTTTPLPTAVGFCMLMKGAVLELIGGLDPAFGRGYHEENDWCVRAQRRGFRIVRANRALVLHAGGLSFGEERAALDLRHAAFLEARHPGFTELGTRFSESVEAQLPARCVGARLERLCVELDLRGLDPDALEAFAPILVALEALSTSLRLRTEGPEADRILRGAGPELLRQPADEEVHLLHRLAPPRSARELEEVLGTPFPLVVSCDAPGRLRGPWTDPADPGDFFDRRALELALLGAAQGVVTGTAAAAALLIDELGLDAGALHPIPPALSAAPPPAERPPGVERPYLLCVEDERRPQNVDLAVAGFALAVAAGSPLDLVVVARPGAVALPLASPLAGRVHRLEPPDAARRRAWIAAADGVLALSTWECAEAVLLEALSAGVPAVVSPLGGSAEVAEQTTRVLSAPTPAAVASAIRSLGTSSVKERAEAAARSAAERSPHRAAKLLLASYRAALGDPAPRSLALRQAFLGLLGSARGRRGER